MSVLLVLVALVALVVVGVAVLGVVLVMRGDSSSDRERLVQATAARSAERASDVAFFFRFEQQDAVDAQALVQRYRVELSATETRDAALELKRLVPSATHAYLGPCAWPPVKAYSPVTQGVIVGFRARTRVSLDTVEDDRHATALADTLGQISALPDSQLLGGHLQLAADSTDPDAPRLVPVDQGTLPGHRPCPHCRKPVPVFATRCEACGSRAMS